MYHRIVLKLSGETLSPAEGTVTSSPCYDPTRVDLTADTIISLAKTGVQTVIVLGGGNVWRGRFDENMDPVIGDQMGMLATIMNALTLCEAINRRGGKARVFSAQEMTRFCDLYRADRVIECLESGTITLLAGGTGNPFFTTDTGAALRAAELKADAVFKGTTVDGVYSADPKKHPDAVLLKDITYADCVEKELHVMDITAFQLCREKHVPCIRVFNMDDLSTVIRVANGEDIGTIVHE